MKKDSITPDSYYYSRLEILGKRSLKEKKRLKNLSLLRLTVFLITAFLMYWFYTGFLSLIYMGFPGLAVFLFLVSKYTDLKSENIKTGKLIEINSLELEILKGKFNQLPEGLEYNDPEHEFCKDIDLFGKGSFFQYLNRTSLNEGESGLADFLKQNKIHGISQKQEALKELAAMADWRQEFMAKAALVQTEITTNKLVRWIENYQHFMPVKAKLFSLVFSSVSTLLILGVFFGLVYENYLILWFFTGLGITGLYFKRVNQLSEQTSRLKNTFDQYSQIMYLLESKKFNAAYINNRLAPVQEGDLKCSYLLKKFSMALDALDQRNNMLFGVLANGFFLWDMFQARRIEKWLALYDKEVKRWFDLISFFDTHNALANFVFNHPDYTFPKINHQNKTKAVDAAHPLIATKKVVKNTFEIENRDFLVITGANMAGKSTFLRTVSLLIVMANSGLPVCATSFDYHPFKLITSMRTSDSLTDDESYFFSELKRLKFIVEVIEKDQYFVILDEILKGTNSIDKASGSKKFIEKLVRLQTTGIVATHDLSLCELEEKIEQVKTYYFDAEIIDDELYFDYTLKKGVCTNMNASFLLKKMKIV